MTEEASWFIRAAALGDLEAVRDGLKRVDAYPGGVDTPDPLGCTPLHAAARAAARDQRLGLDVTPYIAVVRALRQAGASPSAAALNGQCALDHWSVALETLLASLP